VGNCEGDVVREDAYAHLRGGVALEAIEQNVWPAPEQSRAFAENGRKGGEWRFGDRRPDRDGWPAQWVSLTFPQTSSEELFTAAIPITPGSCGA
jgi:hypothetical protein